MDEAKIKFDPRTKMLLLFTMALFVLGGAGGNLFNQYLPLFCMIPLLLFAFEHKWKKLITYLLLYGTSYAFYLYAVPYLKGFWGYILLAYCGILTRFLPGIVTAAYLMETTKVNEFNAAMERMHVTNKITIPLSVMFRFFPTIAEEFSSINDAMRMREIKLGGKNAGEMVEYRLIPLMVCSAKIGEELNAAAITRGLGGDVRRTNVCKIGFHIQDYILIFICLIPYVICAVSLIRQMFG